MINFGIDLGTTNSAIAKFEKGEVEVFRNPVSLKQTLPSVVAFRKNRIIVGDKAREYLEKDPKNVIGAFKRKMGTSENYPIASLNTHKSPIELSAFVLKELKNFVHTGEVVDAAVITIPASFDTIQSNATKKAGEAAGFQQVQLLQEPIAASLAYANKDENATETGKWLVYDLGGGTFDVALVEIKEGEMKVLDHEGDNFLGGTDFDQLIVDHLIIPFLLENGSFENLEQELKSASGKYNKLFNILLKKAEDAKILLSNAQDAEIEFEVEDDNDTFIDAYFTITRTQFETLIQSYINKTIEMVQIILDRNQLSSKDLKYILMVGGSTYIPAVRTMIGDALNIPVNCNIDPTSAIAIGAAFYAGTKPKNKPKTTQKTTVNTSSLIIKVAYQKTTQEEEEFFTALIDSQTTLLYYRIIRLDGGFDSGLKPLTNRISEYLPMAKNTHNLFEFKVYDDKNNLISTNVETIGITHGRYNVVGQPLPNDICLEIDDMETAQTTLEIIFEKNAILPTKRTLVKEITKTIKKGSDERLTINIVEGPGYAMPSANQTIGFISISGKDLTRDLIKGSDVEITLEMSESRDLTINVYLMLTDQEYENIFNPSERQVNVNRLSEELYILYENLNTEVRDAERQENYEVANTLATLKSKIRSLLSRTKKLSPDDVTDEKFQIEDKKRKIAQQIDNLTRDKYIIQVKMAYFKAKKVVQQDLEEETTTEEDKRQFEQITEQEKAYLATNSRLKIQEKIDQLYDLRGKMMWRNPSYLISLFYHYCSKIDEFLDKNKAKQVIEQGETAIENKNYDKLKVCINQLFGLLPPKIQKTMDKGGTGIG